MEEAQNAKKTIKRHVFDRGDGSAQPDTKGTGNPAAVAKQEEDSGLAHAVEGALRSFEGRNNKHGVGNDRVTTDKPPAQPLANLANTADRHGSDELAKTTRTTTLNPTGQAFLDDSTTAAAFRNPQSEPDSFEQQLASPGRLSLPLHRDDPQEAALGEIRRQRSPLTEMYHPYICPSDASVHDARRRLETALEQTRRLRQAFTERVYGKYRVCLVPPPASLEEILDPIRQNPAETHTSLQQEMEQIRLEKELEKRDASHLNTELSRSKNATANLNIDHAEQLMYMSAGLNLVILPEDEQVDPDHMKNYTDGRGPLQPTGARNRSISHAAATSGEVILDRARRAIAMRNERQKQNKAQILSGQTPTTASQLTAMLQTTDTPQAAVAAPLPIAAETSVPSGVEPVTNTSTTKKPPTSSARTPRGRAAAGLSPSSLLSLHPHSDQLDVGAGHRHTASTAALLAKSAGNIAVTTGKATTQWRLRHPHPESLGGRRRAGSVSSTQPTQALRRLTLPPLPIPKDRSEKKPLAVISIEEARTPRAKKAIEAVLQPLRGSEQTRPVTNLGLLHYLRKQSNRTAVESDSDTEACVTKEPSEESDLDPTVAYLVMRSIGLIGDPAADSPAAPERVTGVVGLSNHSKLDKLHQDLSGSSSSITQTFEGKRGRDEAAARSGVSAKRARTERPLTMSSGKDSQENALLAVPVESIRGGGDSKEEEKHGSSLPEQRNGSHSDNHRIVWNSNVSVSSSHAHRSGSQGMNDATSAASSSNFIDMTQQVQSPATSTGPGYLPPAERYNEPSGLNALQLAQQLQTTSFHGPPSEMGNNMPYLSGVAQRHFVQAPTASGMQQSRSSLPISMPRQNLPEAQARFARDQHAAALLHGAAAGYQQQPTEHYQHVGTTHPSTVAALLNQNHYLAHSQYGINAVQAPMANQFTQPIFQTSHVSARETESFGDRTMQPSDATHRREASKTRNTKPPERSTPPEKNAKQPPTAAAAGSLPQQKVLQATPTATREQQTQKDRRSVNDSVAPDRKDIPPKNNDRPEQQGLERLPPPRVETRPTKVVSAGLAAKPTSLGQTRSSDSSSYSAESKVSAAPAPVESGLKFAEPPAPPLLDQNGARLTRAGRFDEAIADDLDSAKTRVALAYLLSVSAAVPIPKALVANPLKESISPSGRGGNSANTIPRDIVASTILVWLWANHEDAFQSAFRRSGRIDVDAGCKWLIQACVEASVKELVDDLAKERSAPSSDALYIRLAAARKQLAAQKQGSAQDMSSVSGLQAKVEIHTAALVSGALSKQLSITKECDGLLPNLQSCTSYLDELRFAALQAKAQERTLLASLVSRKATMTESFSHAYVSSMVRTGEAVGHDKLFEAVQNEDVAASTMIPYDVFTDETSEWEEPCKPQRGMTVGLTADGLTRRAHARAMIQKSLRKLQDKCSIEGGTPSPGPFADPASINAPGKLPGGGKFAPGSSPRASAKRRSSTSEPPVPPGTGSSKATSWAVFNPRSFSEPLQWNATFRENLPYGRHFDSDGPRSLSLSLIARTGDPRRSKKPKLVETKTTTESSAKSDADGLVPRSTLEIPWSDVADIFQHVELPKKSSSRASSASHHESTPVLVDGRIFAPFCRRIDNLTDDPDESDTEEDTSDETVLQRHEVVLDRMKQKMSAYMEARRQQQERRKSRSKGRS